jgi:hypothetical protein
MPTKHQLSPHKHHKIVYGQTTQLTHNKPYSPPLSTEGIKGFQCIIGTLLYYASAVYNKLLATLGTLGSQQATTTKAMAIAINQLLDYLATYPNNGTTYCASNMILCAYTDASFHNESKGCRRACTHIFVSKNDLVSKYNGPVLSIFQIMKFVMSSAAEAELRALYTTANEMVPLQPTQIQIGLSHTLPSKLTTLLSLESPTSPLSCGKPSPLTSAYGGSNAANANPNNSSVTTGTMAATIGRITTPNTTHQSTTSPTDQQMQVQHT